MLSVPRVSDESTCTLMSFEIVESNLNVQPTERSKSAGLGIEAIDER